MVHVCCYCLLSSTVKTFVSCFQIFCGDIDIHGLLQNEYHIENTFHNLVESTVRGSTDQAFFPQVCTSAGNENLKNKFFPTVLLQMLATAQDRYTHVTIGSRMAKMGKGKMYQPDKNEITTVHGVVGYGSFLWLTKLVVSNTFLHKMVKPSAYLSASAEEDTRLEYHVCKWSFNMFVKSHWEAFCRYLLLLKDDCKPQAGYLF